MNLIQVRSPRPVRLLPAPSPVPVGGPGPVFRFFCGLFAGVAVACLVVAGRLSGVLLGWPGLLVATLLLLLVPTSRELSRRVLLGGCVVLGWTQLLWWQPLPLGEFGRVTAVLALLAAGLSGWVAAGERPLSRLRRLVPRVRVVDLLAPVAATLAAVVLAPWLQERTHTQTLGLLLGGYDNSAHFSMVHMIRRFGVTVDALGPAPDGARWQFDAYPQGFHTVVAAIVELVAGPSPGDLGRELTGYSHAVAIFAVGVVALLVAGFCALPALRNRPGIAVPVSAFVTTVVVVGPGAHAIEGGIGNFTMACALVVAAALLVVPVARICRPLALVALGGAVVGVATSWILLLAPAVPVLLALLVPWRRRRWAATPAQIALSVAVVALVLGSLARTASVIAQVQAESPLTLTGGSVPVDVGLVVAAALGTLGACLLVRNGHAVGGVRRRVSALLWVPLAGAATAVALIVVQLGASGEISYYGFKFLFGTEIVLLVLLMIPVAHLAVVRRRPARGPVARIRAAAGSAALAVAATQVFGLTVPDLTEVGLPRGTEGLENLTRQLTDIEDPPSTAYLVDRAIAARQGGPTAYYLDVGSDGRVDPVLAAQWYLALTDTWTLDANAVVSTIRLPDGPLDIVYAAESARRILRADPDGIVVVPAAYVTRLLDQLNDRHLTPRIRPV